MDSVEESGFPYSLPTSGTAPAGASAAASAGAGAGAGAGQAGPTPAKQQQQHFEALLQDVPLSASLTATGAHVRACDV